MNTNRIHSSAVIEDKAVITEFVTIKRHCRIRDLAHIGPFAYLEDYTRVGMNAFLNANIHIGHHSKIPAQAVILPNDILPPHSIPRVFNNIYTIYISHLEVVRPVIIMRMPGTDFFAEVKQGGLEFEAMPDRAQEFYFKLKTQEK